MKPVEQESILTLALMAAFADGAKHDAERGEIKRMAESLPHAEVQPAALYQRVLLKRVTTAQAAAPLQSPELRHLAYEMAVCVCDADGAQSDAEKAFLAGLRRELKLEEKAAAAVDRAAEEIAVEPLADLSPVPPVVAALPAAAVAAAAVAAAPPVQAAEVDARVDKMVLNYAILNGALELLPQSLATMAIVPLQMKMVYRVGKSYGHELGRGHIKELLAAAGVGLTSQVLEGYARKLLGGLLARRGGGLLQKVGTQATSSVMSFAATWALGKLAKQYYSGGRRLSAIELRSLFGSLTQQARSLHSRYSGEIQQKAGSVNISQLLPLIRGQ